MSGQRPDAVPGWISPGAEQPTGRRGKRPKGPRGEQPSDRYYRSIAWTLLAWVVAVGVVYLVSQMFGFEQLGGWLGLAGFVLGIGFGGVRGGITDAQQWATFVLVVLGIAVISFGVGACVAAMAAYG